MSVEEMIEYHNHKGIMEDLEADSIMKRWYDSPVESRGPAPYKQVDD